MKILIAILFFGFYSMTFAQSKKEEIEILKLRTDSLNRVISNERISNKESITLLNESINNLKKELADSLKSLELLKIQNKNLIAEASKQKNEYNKKETEYQKRNEELNAKLTRLDAAIQKLNDSIRILNSPKSDKYKALSSMIGDHNLSTIEMNSGMNTLIDYYIENGKWKVDASANYDGQREPIQMKISPQILQKLSSLKMRVNEDMSLSLLCNSIEIVKVNYSENGPDVQLEQPREDYMMIPSELSSTSFNFENQIYLFASDVNDSVLTEFAPYEEANLNTFIIYINKSSKAIYLITTNGMDQALYTFVN